MNHIVVHVIYHITIRNILLPM